MDLFLFILLALLAYVLPGAALLQWVRLEGIGRWARILISIPVSLVVVPFTMATVGGFIPFTPTLLGLLILSALFLFGGWLLRRSKRAPGIGIRPRNQEAPGPTWKEWLAVSIFILGFSLVINLHRMEMFIHGDQGWFLPSIDEFRHLTVLISVARSGIPPQHYFFPDISLVYYYWSQIYPASIANQGLLVVSLARAFAFHAFVQTAAFLGLIYFFLRLNARSWLARLFGIASVTVFAGFDYFVTMGMMEWWQKEVPWLTSSNEVFSLPLLYYFGPQHLAGAMAFVFALLIWRNLRAHPAMGAGILGALMAFTFGTSPFVFLGFAVAVFLWAVEYRRILWNKKNILPAVAFLVPFTLGIAKQLVLTMSHPGRIVWSNFRVPLLETFIHAESPAIGLIDKLLTILGMPVVMSWILLIEMGLPLIIYGVWVFQKSWRNRLAWNRLAVLFPAVLFLVTVFWTDQDGGGNFSRRGLIPMQIVIVLAAALSLKDWKWPGGGFRSPVNGRWQISKLIRTLTCIYIVAVFTLSQAVSWLTWLQVGARGSIGCVLRVPKEVFIYGVNVVSCPEMPDSFTYISWLNEHTPTSALVVEEKVPTTEDRRFRLLERMRYVLPDDGRNIYDFRIELEVLRPDDLDRLRLASAEKDVLVMALNSEYYRAHHPPIYFVSRNGERPDLGTPVYADPSVLIYEISDGILQ